MSRWLVLVAASCFALVALGLGALVTTLATTAAADVTGVLLAGLMAAVGLFIIPARRRQGKALKRGSPPSKPSVRALGFPITRPQHFIANEFAHL